MYKAVRCPDMFPGIDCSVDENVKRKWNRGQLHREMDHVWNKCGCVEMLGFKVGGWVCYPVAVNDNEGYPRSECKHGWYIVGLCVHKGYNWMYVCGDDYKMYICNVSRFVGGLWLCNEVRTTELRISDVDVYRDTVSKVGNTRFTRLCKGVLYGLNPVI